MRKYLQINLDDKSIDTEELNGAACIRVGRHFVAKTQLEKGVATVDPLSPANQLIFSAGPLSGTNFSNANRISVGCKSPLTGGIKEANAGGTFAFALGQLEISGLTLKGASDEWVIIRITKDSNITFDDATPFTGMGNIEVFSIDTMRTRCGFLPLLSPETLFNVFQVSQGPKLLGSSSL